MTCKENCIHYGVCKKHYNEENSALPDLFDLWLKPEICSDFKNKADFVEVKHGEWRISNRKEVCICSNCKKAVPFVLICTEPYKVEYDFCPHCGADMRKEGADNG